MKKRTIEVQLDGTLERKPDTAAVVLRLQHAKLLPEESVHAMGNAVKEAFGDEVLVIILSPNEHVETLSEGEMAKRGWVRGTVSDDGNTSIRRKL